MFQVFVRQVVLDLGDQLLDEFGVGGLPALLLQLPSAGPRAAVCRERTTDTISTVSHPQRETTKSVTVFRFQTHNQAASFVAPPAGPDRPCVTAGVQRGDASVPDRDTSVTPVPAPLRPLHLMEGGKVTGTPSHTEYGEVTKICFTQLTRTDGGHDAWLCRVRWCRWRWWWVAQCRMIHSGKSLHWPE